MPTGAEVCNARVTPQQAGGGTCQAQVPAHWGVGPINHTKQASPQGTHNLMGFLDGTEMNSRVKSASNAFTAQPPRGSIWGKKSSKSLVRHQQKTVYLLSSVCWLLNVRVNIT